VVVSDTAASCRALEERKVDLVIVHIIRPIAEELVKVQTLSHDAQVVAVGPDSPWARRRKIALADLINEPWAMPAPESPLGSMVFEAFRANGLEVPATAVVSPLPVRYPLLASGRFLTMIPRVALAFPAQSPPLKALPIDFSTTRRPFGILTLRTRMISPVAQLFIDCAREVAKPLAN
jgi:DNA-binding transcriptional LysR family regulator